MPAWSTNISLTILALTAVKTIPLCSSLTMCEGRNDMVSLGCFPARIPSLRSWPRLRSATSDAPTVTAAHTHFVAVITSIFSKVQMLHRPCRVTGLYGMELRLDTAAVATARSAVRPMQKEAATNALLGLTKAGWRSGCPRQPHKLEIAGSNPVPALHGSPG